jgi:hypothetical protein
LGNGILKLKNVILISRQSTWLSLMMSVLGNLFYTRRIVMKTEKCVGMMAGVAALLVSSVANASWYGITYDHSSYDPTWSNTIVNGGNNTDGYAYSQTIAEDQTLAVSHELRGYFAQTNNDPIKVWSATSVCFGAYNVSTGNGGDVSNIVLRFDFSNDIESAQWTLPGIGVSIAGDGAVAAKYSFDGTTWSDAVNYSGNGSEQTVTLNIPDPTSSIYLGWFGTLTSGNAYFNNGGTGTLTVTSVPEPVTLFTLFAGGIAGLLRRKK